jgi:carbamoyl-phosphate synthase large subunit
VKQLVELGFKIVAPAARSSTSPSRRAGRAHQQGRRRRRHIVDMIVDGEIALIFNTTEGWQSHKDSQSIRARRCDEGAVLYDRGGSVGRRAGDSLG